MACQHLDRQAGFAENDRGNIVVHKHRRDAERLLQDGFTNAELFIDDGRIVKDDMLFSACRAAFVDDFNRTAYEHRSQFAGVGDRRRTANKLRRGTIEFAKARQPSNDVSQI